MWLNILVLVAMGLAAGGAVWLFKGITQERFKLVLAFSGSYLFSVTIIHLLPELFEHASGSMMAGICVLAGFFLQLFLESLSGGVEHGHIHHHHHGHGHAMAPMMLFSLLLHSLMEGGVLVHPGHSHEGHSDHSMLPGLVLHKIPEAFALMSVLRLSGLNKTAIWVYFIIYLFASPVGMLAGLALGEYRIFDAEITVYIFGIVAGNFLHISTTIFFEQSPAHTIKVQKIIFSFIGALMAIAAEVLM